MQSTIFLTLHNSLVQLIFSMISKFQVHWNNLSVGKLLLLIDWKKPQLFAVICWQSTLEELFWTVVIVTFFSN